MTKMNHKTFSGKQKQQGNYLLSIGVGIMIMAILAVWAIPKIQDYLIEGAVPSIAEEVQRFASRVKVNAAGTGATPYSGLNQEYFARSVRGGSLQVVGSGGAGTAGEGTTGTVVLHGLGGGTSGTVSLASEDAGAAFSLTFSNVNHAACPTLATALQRTASTITIDGTAVKTTDDDNNVTSAYNAASAAAQCEDGDVNNFVFTFF